MEQQIVFRVGETEYSLSVEDVLAIEHMKDITKIPNATESILGITNMRGEVLTVISMRKKAGLPETEDEEQTRLLVVSCNGTKVALKVDETKNIVECTEENVFNIPAMLRADRLYVDRVLKHEEDLILVVNPEKLLTQTEQNRVNSQA